MKRTFTLLFLIIFSISRLSYAQSLTIDTLLNNGNKLNRINLVFLGDGYTSDQQTKFISDINVIVAKLFATTPFKEYESFFNVYAIHVISQESGARHPNAATDCNTANPQIPVSAPNTYLSSSFDYGGIHRLLYCENTAVINEILQDNFPWYDKALIVANTPYYGGSGGTFSICSTDPNSAEIMIHELGHSFAGLGDEYGGTSCHGVELPNVTSQTNPDLIKWKDWIPNGLAIPTPSNTNCSSIGLYQGANYCNAGWYRPKCNCKMNMLNNPFCEICTENFIYSINNFISLIDSYQPQNGVINLNNEDYQNFSATFLTPVPNSIKVTWKLDNNIVASNVDLYSMDANSLMSGTHSLVLTATDTTYRSKIAMPSYTKTWTIVKNGDMSVTLPPFNPVCSNASDFRLTGGRPAGGVYAGAGVTNNIFDPAQAGIGTHIIGYKYQGFGATQPITVDTIPLISAQTMPASCPGNEDGSIHISVDEQTAFNYNWSNGSITKDILNLQAGIYEVTVTTSGKCEQFASFAITNKEQECSTSGVAEAGETSDEKIQLYPNPSTGVFNMQSAAWKENNVQVIITDVFGREMIRRNYTAEGEFRKTLDISALPAGIYFVRIKKGSEVINKKITKV